MRRLPSSWAASNMSLRRGMDMNTERIPQGKFPAEPCGAGGRERPNFRTPLSGGKLHGCSLAGKRLNGGRSVGTPSCLPRRRTGPERGAVRCRRADTQGRRRIAAPRPANGGRRPPVNAFGIAGSLPYRGEPPACPRGRAI